MFHCTITAQLTNTALSLVENYFRVSTFQILNLFDRDLEEVEKEYVFRSMKVGGEGFHYSKMARWAADTRKKLEQEVNVSVRQGEEHMILVLTNENHTVSHTFNNSGSI